MRAEEFITEAPLADYVPLGDFNKPGPFRKQVDKKLITHPTNQLKTAQFFEKTPYDFRLFFSNIPGTGKRNEIGAVSPDEVIETFGEQVGQQIIQGHEDAITIVFLGNFGSQAVMMTPWVMAHRIGHAITASNRRNNSIRSWEYIERHFFGTINQALTDVYGHNEPSKGVAWNREKEYNALFNAIGTQRSSREGQINRPYEFMYEMFAQYLKTGTVTLNPFPAQLGYGKMAWGNQRQMKARPIEDEDLTQALAQKADTLGYDMEILFNDVLAECHGKIFLM